MAMTPIARITAAIEILTDIEARRRPASDALKDWGLSHRFAGSKDRSAIGALVFDALRVKASATWIMKAETPRALVLGSLALVRGLSVEDIAALCPAGERFASMPLSAEETDRLNARDLSDAPLWVRGNLPKWLESAFVSIYGEDAEAEGVALSQRAPVDLRVNTLKATRDEVLAALAHLGAQPAHLSPVGLRIVIGEDGRGPALQAEPAHALGQIEVQDEGSQLAALLSSVKPGMRVMDFCAGGGGKTLALAAMMHNQGTLVATDADGRRLMPIFDRLTRAGITNVEVRSPKAKVLELDDLLGRQDVVFVDAPCTGSGTWRRNPDAKWRLRQPNLSLRLNEQDQVLDKASNFAKIGGRMIYVTCSVLREENEERVSRFLRNHPGWVAVDSGEMIAASGLEQLRPFASRFGAGIRLSPHSSGTDGFYVAALRRQACACRSMSAGVLNFVAFSPRECGGCDWTILSGRTIFMVKHR